MFHCNLFIYLYHRLYLFKVPHPIAPRSSSPGHLLLYIYSLVACGARNAQEGEECHGRTTMDSGSEIKKGPRRLVEVGVSGPDTEFGFVLVLPTRRFLFCFSES